LAHKLQYMEILGTGRGGSVPVPYEIRKGQTDKHLTQSPLTGQFLRKADI
jgi:hypothetical protein